jgi:hypothetical protein
MSSSQMQVIGFGAAALGLAIAADREDKLNEYLDRGLVFIDGEEARAPWRSLNYAINANSNAGDFISAIRPDGAFGSLLNGKTGRLLMQHQTQPVSLHLVATFFGELAQCLKRKLASFPRSGIKYGSRVCKLVLEEDQSISSFGTNGDLIRHSRSAVLALGAEQPVARFKQTFFFRIKTSDHCAV